jgi:hypothetical protein
VDFCWFCVVEVIIMPKIKKLTKEAIRVDVPLKVRSWILNLELAGDILFALMTDSRYPIVGQDVDDHRKHFTNGINSS